MKLANLAGRAVPATGGGTADVARDSDGHRPRPTGLYAQPFEQPQASRSTRAGWSA